MFYLWTEKFGWTGSKLLSLCFQSISEVRFFFSKWRNRRNPISQWNLIEKVFLKKKLFSTIWGACCFALGMQSRDQNSCAWEEGKWGRWTFCRHPRPSTLADTCTQPGSQRSLHTSFCPFIKQLHRFIISILFFLIEA